jgi:hypothetical protein
VSNVSSSKLRGSLTWDPGEFGAAIGDAIPQIIGVFRDDSGDVRETAIAALAKLSQRREHCQLPETAEPY